MRVLKKFVYWFVLPIVVLLIILILFGRQWVFSYLSPPETFVLADAPTAPDYDNAYFWVANPNKIDTSDLVPVGINTSGDMENKEVDVFFVHSTGFVGPGGWNSTMKSENSEAQSIEYLLSSMASRIRLFFVMPLCGNDDAKSSDNKDSAGDLPTQRRTSVLQLNLDTEQQKRITTFQSCCSSYQH